MCIFARDSSMVLGSRVMEARVERTTPLACSGSSIPDKIVLPFSSGYSGVSVELDQAPALGLDEILDVGRLGIQAVSFGLLLGRYSPVPDGP